MIFSIVIALHNEEENIAPLLIEITQKISPRHQYEIVCVDDYSSDQTTGVLREYSEKIPNLLVIHLSKRQGQSVALRIGVNAAKNPMIVTIEGNGQNDPSDIEGFLACFSSEERSVESLLVNGYRKREINSRGQHFTSFIAYTFGHIILHDPNFYNGCGLKAFPKDLFLGLPVFDQMHRFLPSLVFKSGGRVLAFPAKYHKRFNGISNSVPWYRTLGSILELLCFIWIGRRGIQNDIKKPR